jgi:hypothetical protein
MNIFFRSSRETAVTGFPLFFFLAIKYSSLSTSSLCVTLLGFGYSWFRERTKWDVIPLFLFFLQMPHFAPSPLSVSKNIVKSCFIENFGSRRETKNEKAACTNLPRESCTSFRLRFFSLDYGNGFEDGWFYLPAQLMTILKPVSLSSCVIVHITPASWSLSLKLSQALKLHRKSSKLCNSI